LTDAEQDPKPATQKPEAERTIADEIALFATHVDSLAETLPLAEVAIEEAMESSRKLLLDFIQELTVGAKGQNEFVIEPGKILLLRRLTARVQKTSLASQLVPRSLLVSLVSQFDAFIGKLIRQLFKLRPEILNASANALTFAQLVAFSSLDDARDYVVDKEIEQVLRKSHAEQFDWFENKFDLPLRTDLKAWPLFVEVTERRNLFVHTDGIVSHQYIEVCKRNSCDTVADVRVGQTLQVTKDYFVAAHECLFEIGVKLAQVLWRKLNPTDLVNADNSLIRTIFDLLSEGRLGLARVLSDFALEVLKRHGTDELRLVMVVNRAQAYKWSGDEDSCKKIVNSEDWSARSAKFRLARAVLLDEFDAAIAIFRSIGPHDEDLHKDTYREWPLYRVLRTTQEFASAFEDVFGEPLNKVKVPPEGATPGPNTVVN
jgi:hypothetical protein